MINFSSVWEFIQQWYWLPLAAMYLVIIITILSENRNPSKTLAYILVLTFLPVLGLLIYYFLGRKPVFKRWTFVRRALTDRLMLEDYFKKLHPQMQEHLNLLEQKIGEMVLPFRYLVLQKQSLISTGNHVELLINGEEKFPALIAAMENAVHHIHLEYYIFSNDILGNEVADILIKKFREGLEVRVIVDDVGSAGFRKIGRKFKEAGLIFYKSLPVAFSSLANSNYRNHRKIVIVDGVIGFIGGLNIDERYWNRGNNPVFWRDTALRIEGPAVNLLQVQFFLSWYFSGGEDSPAREGKYFNSLSTNHGEAIVAVAASGPSSKAPYIMETILLAISQARTSIRICTPYFIPNDQMISALMIAASNGVKVEIIIPEKGDSYLVQHASFSFLKPLLERGVRVYLYEKGFLHSKTISIDKRVSIIGTVNMDTRSFLLNFEVSALVYEEYLCLALEKSFETDLTHSRLITLAEWQSRSVWVRALDSICRLVAPVL